MSYRQKEAEKIIEQIRDFITGGEIEDIRFEYTSPARTVDVVGAKFDEKGQPWTEYKNVERQTIKLSITRKNTGEI